MKEIKRNSSLNFPIKLNYKSNDLIFSYRSGKPINKKLINVNKNKYFIENKSFISCDKNMKDISNLSNPKLRKNKNKKNEINSELTNNSYNNLTLHSFIGNYTNINDDNKYLNNFNFYSYKNKINDIYNTNYWKDTSKIPNNNSKYNISNTIANINTNNNINNINKYIFPYNQTNDFDKNFIDNKKIYQKPKNERSLSSYSFAMTDCNTSNKENISVRSNINTETNCNICFSLYNNLNQYKYNNMIGPQRYTEVSSNTNFIQNKINNYLYFYDNYKNNSYMNERKTNIDYSKLNLYTPKDLKENKKYKVNYIRKNRPHIKSDIIKNDIGDTISFLSDKNYLTTNDNNSYIYVRKNSSKKLIINKSSNYLTNNNNNKNFTNKIRVNLKSNNIIENAYYVQKNVILIQKNYRMHLACLKKYILKAIKKIIEGTNKLYYLFYKNYSKKFIYILNNAYIKSIDINIKTSKIIPKCNRYKSYEDSKNNYITKPKRYHKNNQSERNKNLFFKGNRKMKVIYSPKSNDEINTKFNITILNQIQKDIELIKNLKNRIINRLDKLKK